METGKMELVSKVFKYLDNVAGETPVAEIVSDVMILANVTEEGARQMIVLHGIKTMCL